MRTKKVNRYYCDFCKKSGCSASHMSRHEKRCALNPERECRVCDIMGNCVASVVEMMELLPNSSQVNGCSGNGSGLEEVSSATIQKLNESAGGCPACMMAALRQRKIPAKCWGDFNSKEMMQEVFAVADDADSWRRAL